MKIAGIVIPLTLWLSTFGAGCKATNQADGATCSDKSECQSGECTEGTCAGKTDCMTDDGSGRASGCDPGWSCEPGRTGTILFAGTPSQCVPDCGSCPANYHCPLVPAANLAPGKVETCTSGSARTGTIEGPDTVKAGSPVSYTVHFSPDEAFTSFDWYVVDPVTKGRTELSVATPDSPTTSLYLTGEARDAQLYVIATRSPTGLGPQINTEAIRDVHIACLAMGEDCNAMGSCCVAGLTCCYDTNHTCQ